MKDVVVCDKPWRADKLALTQGFPNGETHPLAGTLNWIHRLGERTRGTETSKYPEEKKSTEIPSVAASERGTALKLIKTQQNALESAAIEGDSPVCEGSF